MSGASTATRTGDLCTLDDIELEFDQESHKLECQQMEFE